MRLAFLVRSLWGARSSFAGGFQRSDQLGRIVLHSTDMVQEIARLHYPLLIVVLVASHVSRGFSFP
jgi:hypothetical protein